MERTRFSDGGVKRSSGGWKVGVSGITPGALKVEGHCGASDFSVSHASNVIILRSPRRRGSEVVAFTRTYMHTTVILEALTAPLAHSRGGVGHLNQVRWWAWEEVGC